MTEPVRLWGARFRSPPSEALMNLSRSPANYFRLVPEDLMSSVAHARELMRAGILTEAEAEEIIAALKAIGEGLARRAHRPLAGR